MTHPATGWLRWWGSARTGFARRAWPRAKPLTEEQACRLAGPGQWNCSPACCSEGASGRPSARRITAVASRTRVWDLVSLLPVTALPFQHGALRRQSIPRSPASMGCHGRVGGRSHERAADAAEARRISAEPFSSRWSYRMVIDGAGWTACRLTSANACWERARLMSV
jgi:hypothetical protein